VEVFLGRLRQGRQAFINNFLSQEIKKIAKSLGFKNFPIPYYEDFDLKDDSNARRIYTRLIELGILTPEEGLTAIETGRLPDKESSLNSQKELVEYRDQGFYQPLIGGAKSAEPAGSAKSAGPVKSTEVGRPVGTDNIKQSTKKISPIGASYSCAKVRDNLLIYGKVIVEVESQLKKKFKLKKLNQIQSESAEEIARTVILNEEKVNWFSSVAKYVENPIDNNFERIEKIKKIGIQHELDLFLASILSESQN